MKQGFYRVYLHDELPTIGSGHRTLYVDRVGRLWASLRCPFTLVGARLRLSVWESLKPTPYRPSKSMRNYIAYRAGMSDIRFSQAATASICGMKKAASS